MNPYWSKTVQNLVPYVPGEQPRIKDLIKLNTNENPYPPSTAVLQAIQDADGDMLRRYPDPNAHQLKQVIAQYYDVGVEQVFVGNGSDEVLAHIFKGLLKHFGPVLFPDISYSFYPVYCGLFDIDYKTIPLDDSFRINVADYDQPNGGIIFANPNAPTGIALELNEIEQLLSFDTDSVVVVDEAYVDFGAESAIRLINQHDNLLVVQTLSKSRALPGLRVGFAIGDAGLIEGLERVKNSFNSYPLGSMAQLGAIAAIEDEDWFQNNRAKVMKNRSDLSAALAALGFEVLPSTTNFVFVTHPNHEASWLAEELRNRAILVRHFKHAQIEQYLRITVGTQEQCQKLIDVCRELLVA